MIWHVAVVRRWADVLDRTVEHPALEAEDGTRLVMTGINRELRFQFDYVRPEFTLPMSGSRYDNEGVQELDCFTVSMTFDLEIFASRSGQQIPAECTVKIRSDLLEGLPNWPVLRAPGSAAINRVCVE